MFGTWRSEKTSCMIDNRQYFSAWQRYLIVKRIFTLAGEESSFSFEKWLENDVTFDPVRDAATRSADYSVEGNGIMFDPPTSSAVFIADELELPENP